jgi:CheY-like chemotaxis protein
VICHLPAVRESSGLKPAVSVPIAREPPRILVMDDEELFLEIMASILHALGYEVDLAPNGDKALALYQQAMETGRPFDVVMLDLTIRGGMGGTETIKLMRERDPAVRAVLMTGYSNEPVFRSYAQHGFKAALEKPFSAGTLRTTLVEILQLVPGLHAHPQ